MRKFVEGDKLTLEDVRQAIEEAHDRNIKCSAAPSGINIESYLSEDGYYEFDSWEEYKRVFGDFVSVEEAFSGKSSISENNEK